MATRKQKTLLAKTRPSTAGGGLSRRRRWAFRMVALLLPVLTVVGAEWLARHQGYGGYPPFLTRVGSDGTRVWYSTFRPGVDSFFYTGKSHTGGMRTIAFTTPKPTATFRVLLLGGSAMQGYPQEVPLTTGGFLEAMLSDVLPASNQVEVINMGATAMASFPALCFLREMLRHQPDVVVVMSGNNEFFGAYGVCSLHTSGTSPAGMRFMRWARGLGLVQWAGHRLSPPLDEKSLAGKPLMQVVVGEQQVGPDDRLRRAAERTLHANLEDMVRLCHRADVPLILCTLPTNERDLAPVGEDLAPQLSPGARREWEELVARANNRLSTDPAAAVPLLTSALALAPDQARTHYLLGRARTALGEDEVALDSYVAARDLDTMPWRATSAADRAVRQAAERDAVLCDMQAVFRAHSPGGSIGWELMDDHVHMSVQGQALFARTLVEAMARASILPGADPSSPGQLASDEAYADRQGRSALTDYVVASRMDSIFSIPFMTNSNPAGAARWAERLQASLDAMTQLDREAVARWEDPGLHVTSHRPLTGVVGYYRMMDGDYAGAAPLFRVARASVANVSLFKLQFTWWLIHCQREAKGGLDAGDLALCREAIEIGELLERFTGFMDPLGPSYLGMAYHAVGDDAACITYLDNAVRYAKGREGIPVVSALADSLIRQGDRERAQLLLNLARRDPAIEPMATAMLLEHGMVVRDIPRSQSAGPADTRK